MELLLIAREVSAPIDAVWDIVRDFGRADRWIPECQCDLHGEGVGAVRTIRYSDGSQVREIRERLEALDDAEFSLAYRMVSGSAFPVEDSRCRIRLRQGGDVATTWVEIAFSGVPADSTDLSQALGGLALRTVERIGRLRAAAAPAD